MNFFFKNLKILSKSGYLKWKLIIDNFELKYKI
jgi:hypothetical protein